MNCTELGFANASSSVLLWEDARTISEAIYNWGVELAKHDPESLFQLIINDHMLICTKEPVREIVERFDGIIGCVLPIVTIEVKFSSCRLLL
jgi:hypothetical protein